MLFDFFNPEDFASNFQQIPSVTNHKLKSVIITIEGGPTLELSNISFMEANNAIVKFMLNTPPVPPKEDIKENMDRISKIPTNLEQNVNTRRRTKPRD